MKETGNMEIMGFAHFCEINRKTIEQKYKRRVVKLNSYYKDMIYYTFHTEGEVVRINSRQELREYVYYDFLEKFSQPEWAEEKYRDLVKYAHFPAFFMKTSFEGIVNLTNLIIATKTGMEDLMAKLEEDLEYKFVFMDSRGSFSSNIMSESIENHISERSNAYKRGELGHAYCLKRLRGDRKYVWTDVEGEIIEEDKTPFGLLIKMEERINNRTQIKKKR